jgi:hypothetical protein
MTTTKKPDKPKRRRRRKLPPDIVAFNACVVALEKLEAEELANVRALLDVRFQVAKIDTTGVPEDEKTAFEAELQRVGNNLGLSDD